MEIVFQFLDNNEKILYQLIVPKWRDITSRVVDQLSQEFETTKIKLVFRGDGSELSTRFA